MTDLCRQVQRGKLGHEVRLGRLEMMGRKAIWALSGLKGHKAPRVRQAMTAGPAGRERQGVAVSLAALVGSTTVSIHTDKRSLSYDVNCPDIDIITKVMHAWW